MWRTVKQDPVRQELEIAREATVKENTNLAVRNSAAAESPVVSGYRLPAIFTRAHIRIPRFPPALSRGIVLPLIVRGRYAFSHGDLMRSKAFATDLFCKYLTARLSSGNKLLEWHQFYLSLLPVRWSWIRTEQSSPILTAMLVSHSYFYIFSV